MFRQNRRTGALLGYVRTLFGLRVALERADPVWATCGPCEERADPSGVRGTLVGNVRTLRGYVGTLFGVRGDHFRGTFGSVLGYVWTLWGYVGTLSRYVGTLFGVRWTIVGYVEDPLGVRGDPSGIRGDPVWDTWGPLLGSVGPFLDTFIRGFNFVWRSCLRIPPVSDPYPYVGGSDNGSIVDIFNDILAWQ